MGVDVLWPMQHSDAGTDDPLRYAERDPIGVEVGGEYFRGFNELAGWTERVTIAAGKQHNLLTALHDTLLIPRAVIHLEYRSQGTPEYFVREDSYLLGKRGVTVAKAAITAPGEFRVELESPLASTGYRLMGGGISLATQYRHIAVRLHTILNASQFIVRRYAGIQAIASELVPAHGDCTLLLYA